QHVRDGLNAAMRMPGESLQIFLGHIVAKVVEQKKGIELVRGAEAESAPQMHSRTFNRRPGPNETFNRSNGHSASLGGVLLLMRQGGGWTQWVDGWRDRLLTSSSRGSLFLRWPLRGRYDYSHGTEMV